MERSREPHANRIWLTWEIQTRNRSLSSRMGATLFEKDPNLPALLRYPYLIAWAAWLLFRNKAKIVFVQNPSLILSCITILLGKFILKKHIIVDAHNVALENISGFWKFLERVRVFVIKNATYTIVSNDELANRITIYGGVPLVLADPLPEFNHAFDEYKLTGKYNLLYICSWADDEPYCEVLKAALLLNDSINLYISGNSRAKHKTCLTKIPENVILTGFLKSNEFEYILHNVDVIIDLTTRDSCLLCGAYEGVSAERPLVLSDTAALRKYFYKGAVYTDNTAVDICEKVNQLLSNRRYLLDVVHLKREINISWEIKKSRIDNLICDLE